MITFLTLTIIIIGLLLQLFIFGIHKTGAFHNRKDLFVCFGIILIYAAYAFTNLGNLQSPQSFFSGNEGESVIFNFGENVDIRRMQFMTGPRYRQIFGLEFSYDGENWSNSYPFETRAVFAWDSHDVQVRTRYVRLTVVTRYLHIMELGFRDANGGVIPIVSVEDRGMGLFDEQSLIPTQPFSYMHSTYFDEIYYSRTAYEFIHGLPVYSRMHPPLGKVLISQGIEIFGMTPFGWRFMNVLSGIFALLPLYFLAKALFKSSFWAGFATFIFAFDFMHFVQSRISTLDSFVVLFIISMYYFMYKYTQADLLRDSLAKTLVPLFLSGLFMGLSVATKWSGGFGAIGLAIIFFVTIAQRYLESDPEENKNFRKKTLITLLCCMGFFVVIPAIIYILSHIPFYATGTLHPEAGFFTAIFHNQVAMVNFHLHLDATHAFSSYWWEWIINWRPMLFFDYFPTEGVFQGINTFGNPIVWWGGIPAFAYTFYRAVKRDFSAIFLTIGYLSLFIPWLFASRLSFIYYYYPNVVFLALMIAYSIKTAGIFDKIRLNRRAFACAFAGITFVLFLLFYPILSGVPISINYVETFLRWPFMREWIVYL